MASRCGKHLLRAKSKAEGFGFLAFYRCYFLICCLAAPWLTFGYYWGNSLTHLMLITASGLSILGPKVTVGFLLLIECSVGFDHNDTTLTHSTHSTQIAENTLPRLAFSFSKMWKCLQYLKQLTSLDATFSVQNFSFCWPIIQWVKFLVSKVSLNWGKCPKYTKIVYNSTHS